MRQSVYTETVIDDRSVYTETANGGRSAPGGNRTPIIGSEDQYFIH